MAPFQIGLRGVDTLEIKTDQHAHFMKQYTYIFIIQVSND